MPQIVDGELKRDTFELKIIDNVDNLQIKTKLDELYQEYETLI